jgi:hypothetical protein
MSMASDFITINTVVSPDDKQDLERLATFLLALSRTNLEQRGVRGSGRVVPRGKDYAAVFDGGITLHRATAAGSVLLRQTACPVDGCGVKTFSTTREPEMCQPHWNEMHCEEVA